MSKKSSNRKQTQSPRQPSQSATAPLTPPAPIPAPTPVFPKLEMQEILQGDAAEIVAARTKAVIIHHTKDIDTAGNEVEQASRTVIRRKLPAAYYVGHGHVVDSQLSISPQYDIVIADNTGSPVLFQAKDGTEYFPYEAVYAVGEIKSGYYYKKKAKTSAIHEFVSNLGRFKSVLQRQRSSLTTNLYTTGFSNPLFSFMLFVAGNDFEVDHITELYASTPIKSLPSVVCLLDKGLVLNAKERRDKANNVTGHAINLAPEIQDTRDPWCFVPFGSDDFRLGSNFGALFYYLVEHIRNCQLTNTNMLPYVSRILTSQGHTPFA